MKRSLFFILTLLPAAALAACASPTATSALAAQPAAAVRPDDFGNIRWNKTALHLTYPANGAKDAVLTYWAKNGYSVYPLTCENGSTIDAKAGAARGNPNRYFHVTYAFRATSKTKDTCSLTAVLDDTGSPPFATLTIDVNS